MRLTIDRDDGTYTASTRRITSAACGVLKSERATRILELIAQRPLEPKEIARELSIHEQGVYYHLKRLENAGIIRVESIEKRRGVIAQRYEPSADSFTLLVREPQPSSGRTPRVSTWLEPFIIDGTLNARIIVGSPDPHGPMSARSRDGYYGMDLALLLGTFITTLPHGNVSLDTDARELDTNLIIIGGPIVNSVAGRINDHAPIRFDRNKRIISTITGRTYVEESTGVITRFENPLAPDSSILWVYGLRNAGTRAAITALLARFNELTEGNTNGEPSRVVTGLDLDSDGIVDDVRFEE